MSETLVTAGSNSNSNDAAASAAASAAANQQTPDQQAADKAAADKATADKAAADKAAADKAAADKSAADKAAQKVVPEKYEFKFAEGTKLDSELVGQLEGIAKELGLSQEEAQKVADLGPKLAAKMQSEQQAAIKGVQEQWLKDAQADKEFGGEKLQENLGVAKKALDAFGSPALITLLNETGLGNHPEVIRAFIKAGRAISQDKHVAAGDRVADKGGTNSLELSYPNHPKSL